MLQDDAHIRKLRASCSANELKSSAHRTTILFLCSGCQPPLTTAILRRTCMGIATSPTLDARVINFITKTSKILVDGKWSDAASGKTFDTYNPATGEVLARVADGGREDSDRAVKAAGKPF